MAGTSGVISDPNINTLLADLAQIQGTAGQLGTNPFAAPFNLAARFRAERDVGAFNDQTQQANSLRAALAQRLAAGEQASAEKVATLNNLDKIIAGAGNVVGLDAAGLPATDVATTRQAAGTSQQQGDAAKSISEAVNAGAQGGLVPLFNREALAGSGLQGQIAVTPTSVASSAAGNESFKTVGFNQVTGKQETASTLQKLFRDTGVASEGITGFLPGSQDAPPSGIQGPTTPQTTTQTVDGGVAATGAPAGATPMIDARDEQEAKARQEVDRRIVKQGLIQLAPAFMIEAPLQDGTRQLVYVKLVQDAQGNKFALGAAPGSDKVIVFTPQGK